MASASLHSINLVFQFYVLWFEHPSGVTGFASSDVYLLNGEGGGRPYASNRKRQIERVLWVYFVKPLVSLASSQGLVSSEWRCS